MPVRTMQRLFMPALLALSLAACSGTSLDAETSPAALQIGKVQGKGPVSPYLNQPVLVEGVVTGNFVAGLQGFFMQDAAGEEDGDPATSDGIFVNWKKDSQPRVRRGDRVRVAGMVTEVERGAGRQTTLEADTIEVLGRGFVTALEITVPPAKSEDWERYEGMWLHIQAPLTVTGNEGVLRYGELNTSFSGRQFVPTERHPPGPAAKRLEERNQRHRLILDDNRNAEYPDSPLWYLTEPLSRDAPLRVGSVVHGAKGILHHAFGWRLQLTEPLARIEQAARPASPELPEGLRIASFNVYNWFNGDGQGRGFPTSRGAATLDQMNRQRDKLASAIIGLAPDIVALMEVENDGFGRNSSLAQLVAALNNAWPEADYTFVDAGNGPGKDVMRVAIVYRQSRVAPVGEPLSLLDGAFTSLHRAPLLQTFEVEGKRINVVANHLKSKRCESAEGDNADKKDGQGCWNAARTEAALELDAWVKSVQAQAGAQGSVILGDLNSYAQEDPLRAFRNAGWHDVLVETRQVSPYSFNYRGLHGRLDHALLTAEVVPYLRAATTWAINADESEAFDYRREHREKTWYSPDPYRASDHDPLILVLDFSRH